jgi:hypothetical protein
METQLNVEPSSAMDLRSRILKLPTPEIIEKMSRNELDILQNIVENLLFDVDKATNFRSKDRALRDISKKGIPPYRQPLLANKVFFKCPSCQRVYVDGKWEVRDTTECICADKYCPCCKNNKNIKSHNNWYNSYKNN